MNGQFWNHLFSTASAIEGLSNGNGNGNGNGDRLSRLIAQLESIDVLYHKTFDPADAYEEYVAVTLCRAINKALSTEMVMRARDNR